MKKEIHPENFDHIILLSNNEIEIQESDAQTLICLLIYLNPKKMIAVIIEDSAIYV